MDAQLDARDDERDEDTPRSIGRYCILGPLGRGGMGVVLRAYDPKLRREVAVKLLRARALSDVAKERMIREARAMAKISAANVVSLFDVEILDDDVILVMQYVPGRTLREWTGQCKRAWTETVRVFLQAGRGLAAAHRAGLLHRDFSPANVLVRPDGRALVTDFGLAWLSESDRTGAGLDAIDFDEPEGRCLTRLTADGSIVGTPLYMAPEQFDPNARLDPRVDQYAFCVALWEALAGSPPIRAGRPGLDALVEQKRKGPPRWSAKDFVPKSIVRVLRRGLAPAPEARHPSMDALLTALEGSVGRRRRWLVGVGASVAIGAAVSTYLIHDRVHASTCTGGDDEIARAWNDDRRRDLRASFANDGRSFGTMSRQRIEARLDRYAADWATMRTEACEASAIRQEQSEDVLDLRMMCLDRALRNFGEVTRVLASAERQTIENGDRVIDGLIPLSSCEDVEGLLAAVPPPSDPTVTRAVEELERGLARVDALTRAGAYPQARAELERLWEGRESWSRYEPALADVHLGRARLARLDARYELAEVEATAALKIAMQHGMWDTALGSANELVASTAALARGPAPLAYVDLALGLAPKTLEPIRSEVEARRNSAQVSTVLDRHHEAEAELRTALELVREHRLGVRLEMEIRSRLGQTLRDLRRPEQAEIEHRTVLAALTEELGPNHPELSIVHGMLASALKQQAKFEDAEREFRLALQLAEQGLGPDHPDLGVPLANLAQMLGVTGRSDEAAVMLERAAELFEAKHGAEHPRVAIARLWLAFNRMGARRCDDAEALFREAIAVLRRTEGPDSPNVADALMGLGAIHLQRGEFVDAKAVFEDAQRINEVTSVPVLEPERVSLGIAKAMWGMGRHEAARALTRDFEQPVEPDALVVERRCAGTDPL